MMYVAPKEAQKNYQVSRDTLRRWADEGKIKYEKTNGGHMIYQIEEKKRNQKKNHILSSVL